MTNDLLIDIATANSRKAKTWKNSRVLWSSLVDRLRETTRTAETLAEYKQMSKDRQSEVKDVGGFVGGYCANGKRTQVSSRSLIALDADFATESLWDDWCFLYGAGAALYSTHKHTAEHPRLRLIVPLSRPVDLDEYQACSRRIASTLGIDQFDDSTYQPERLMYYPSTSKDGEYVFELLDAEPINPDSLLSTYADWHDASSWAYSSRVTEVVRKSKDKAQDPLSKDGIVGAFCRAYFPISEAINAFNLPYEPCEGGRYTYTEGSTAAGAIVYDDRFLYSNHSTDPAHEQLCNAWDLVRIHRFGSLDADIDPKSPMSSRPSWREMVSLASNDAQVRAQVVNDRLADFTDDTEPATDDNDQWKKQLRVTKDGAVASTIENVVLILEHDPRLRDALVYDEFNHRITVRAPLPWCDHFGAWNDSDDSALRFYLERVYSLTGKDKIFDAVNVVAYRHKVHPVREFFDGLPEWDGAPRAESLLIDYLGAEDCAYTRAVTRKTLLAAVARILVPGCKFDYILTLRGKQGIGKSSLFRKLGGAWYSDSFSTVQGKDAYEQVLGVWIMEVGELAGMRRAEAESIKLYISKQVDRFRPAYGRRTQEYPRQCIFIGTTNESQFLRDTTGNRRFWVVDTPDAPRLDLWEDLTDEVIAQIWAEVKAMYKSDKQLYLSREMEEEARRVQAEYEEENPKAGLVAAFLDRLLPEDWENRDLFERRQWLEGNTDGDVARSRVCAYEIAVEALGGNPDKIDRYLVKEVNDIMAALPNWKRVRGRFIRTKLYGRQRYYERVSADA